MSLLFLIPRLMIVEPGYLDHWKTNLLRQLTGLPQAAEFPLRLWEYCQSRMDDRIDDPTGNIIAGICRASIQPKKLVKALEESRWIEKTTTGYLVRGWRDRQRGTFASRLNGGKGGRPKKTTPTAQTEPTDNLQVSETEPTDNLQVSETEPNRTHRGVRGDEKRREENPPPFPCASGSPSALIETAAFLTSIFGKKRARLSAEAEHALARDPSALPLSPSQKAMLTWWLGLAPDPNDVYLRSRPRDADKLALRLFSELERAEAHASADSSAEKKSAAPPPELPGWLTAHGFPVVTTLGELPPEIRREFLAAHPQP